MFFFKYFDSIDYSFINSLNESKKVVNILTSFLIRKMTYSKNVIFQNYVLEDHDSIESLSRKLYKNTLHYWTILVINEIINPFYEWFMSQSCLESFTEKKYKNGINEKLIDRNFKNETWKRWNLWNTSFHKYSNWRYFR